MIFFSMMQVLKKFPLDDPQVLMSNSKNTHFLECGDCDCIFDFAIKNRILKKK